MAEHDNVIYLETDEDITSAIDKVRNATGDSVQIVMPKRATLFQSLINQKLLKKAADDAGKTVALVTTDRVAANLASRTGLPIAAKVGAAAIVPVVAAAKMSSDEIDGGAVETAAPAPAPAPEPAVAPPVVEQPAAAPEPQPTQPAAAAPIQRSPLAPASAKAAKPKKKGGVPNFTKMQKRIAWIAAGVLLIIVALIANMLLTSANVTLYAKAAKAAVSFPFTASTTATEVDAAAAIIPAQQLTLNKTISGSAPATGKKDAGTKATGTMTIQNSYDSSPHTLVAGTRFQSPDGKIFKSTSDVTVPGGTLSGGHVVPGTATVGVQADVASDQYNLAPTAYSIPGLAGDQQSGITGKGGQMSGGTTKTLTVVTQADVDKAAQAALANDKDDAKKSLDGKADKDQVVLADSFTQKTTSVTPSPNVDSEASQVNVSVQVAYTELAVKKTDLQALVKAQSQKVVGDNSQLYDDGFGSLQVTGNGTNKFNATATAYAGPKIDTDALAKKIKGKKYGDATDIAGQTPGVEKVDIQLSPKWATNLPSSTKKIKITVKPSDTSGN